MKLPRSLLARSIAFVAAAIACTAFAQSDVQKLPGVRLNAGIHNISAEVARSPDQRAMGLMFRTSMGSSEGMLFVFEEPATQCFWMKNTVLPLSIAFLADDGTVVNVTDMKPQTTESHCSGKPVRYALEMNQGWFAKRGVLAGSRLTGGPFTAR
ncbi:MAG TPA: DUF192 domain-containing protein [Burkholderiaceae bacterium]|jgi:uncharacterized membrane protein (UPF0127 family)|nr:DUF192 domain-containing protein [Burkholderiaceae bacterium]